MIRFEDIAFRYGSEERAVSALHGVTFGVGTGEQVAVLGANGSGKSTLVRLANGILLPHVGAVTVDGIDTRDEARSRDLRQRVGIVFQRPDDQIVATSVEDDVAFGPENLGLPREEIRTRVGGALAAVGLTGQERREPHTLSGGQKQRVAIAGTLAMHPAYLVLDEPTSMLDSRGRADVLAIVSRLVATGTGVLHVTHDLADVARADRVLVLDCGTIAFEGTVAELVVRPDVLEAAGLELPPVAALAERLAALGAPVQRGELDFQTVAAALWG